MHRFALAVATAALLSPAALAQFTHVIPNGTATTEGSTSNAFPWGRGSTASLQIQTIYDSSNFTAASINYPILISRLRWRLNGGGANGTAASYTNAIVQMATATVDQASASTTFAANMATDLTTVYTGPVAVQAVAASTPGAWFVDIPLAQNFLYDPSSGNDLVIFSDLPPGVGTGVPALQMDVQGTNPLACRVYNSTAYGSGTGTIDQNHGVVVEVTYVPAAGLYPSFSATPTTGASPLNVQFTDHTFTSDPAGVLAWQWDLDGDTIIDSTVQNPSFTYVNCGSYNVSLTVIDATHGQATFTAPNFINTDAVVANFTYAVQPSNLVLFTDTSVPTPTSWAWDFNGDSVIDSTAQNPAWVYGAGCNGVVASLTASRLCGAPNTTTKSFVLAANSLATVATGGNGLSASGSGNVFDIQVTNPAGINICALQVAPYATALTIGAPLTVDVYVTDAAGGYASNHTNGAVWRLVATGTGNFNGGTFSAPVLIPMSLNHPIYLPAGTYGMAVHMNGCGVAYSNGVGTNQTFTNADVTLNLGMGKGAPFSATANNPRVWNGAIYYDTAQTGGGAGYGFFGAGCAGTLGIPGQSFSSLPALGQTLSVTVNNLPINAMVNVLGFSRTTSALGQLPLDLAAFGAPGCKARVSPDSFGFVVGANGMASWSLSIPNNAALMGIQAYTQPFVFSPQTNALGAVLGDAAGILIGL